MDPDWTPKPIDLLLGYRSGMDLPKVLPTDPLTRQWNPDDAYCKRPTEEIHWMWVHRSRLTQPWTKIAMRFKRYAPNRHGLRVAREIVRRMISTGIIDMSDIEETDAARAEEALAMTVEIVRSESASHRDRIAAASLLLAYVKAKPAAKSDVTLRAAEDFLDTI